MNLERILLSKRKNYAYNFTPKCACTSMKTALWLEEARNDPHVQPPTDVLNVHVEGQSSARSPWLTNPVEIAADMASPARPRFWFTIVRNPYARAMSAYVSATNVSMRDEYAHYMHNIGWRKEAPPNFREFLERLALMDPHDMDHHWAPITSLVDFDSIGFDFIGAVETLDQHSPALIEKLVGVAPRRNVHLNDTRAGRLDTLSERLDARSMLLIEKIYRGDFDTFGYQFDPTVPEPSDSYLHGLARGGGPSERARHTALMHIAARVAPPTRAPITIRVNYGADDESDCKPLPPPMPQAEAQHAVMKAQWFYPYLVPGRGPVRQYVPEEINAIHTTRRDMMLAALAPDFETDPGELTAIDFASHQGYFSLELAQRCKSVVGLEYQQRNVRDARLMRDALGAHNVEFYEEDLERMPPGKHEPADIVINFGLMYNLENPIGVLRRARELTKRVLLIETQTTILDLAGAVNSGHHDNTNYMHGFFGLFDGNPGNPDGSASDIVFYPSAGGLIWLLHKLGFSSVRKLTPPSGAYQQLATGKRVMIEARL